MRKAKLAVALSTLIAISVGWAAPKFGAALPVFSSIPAVTAPGANVISLRDARGRGLLLNVWINQKGPYTFAVDSGAGTSIIDQKVADETRIVIRAAGRTLLGGLSTAPISSNKEATIANVALGRADNSAQRPLAVAVASNLPNGIDGILDPLELSPSGYSIDLPNRQLIIFDSNQPRLEVGNTPKGGTVVRWIRQAGDTRPFVKLGDGRLALLDTGSNFGLAIPESAGRNHRKGSETVRDLGGGVVQAHRVAPTTINIGVMELRNIPTDLLSGVAPGTPVILGRDALSPFRITFDPVARLIEIVPASER